MRYVYNPADADLPLEFTYNSKRYDLTPNGITAIGDDGKIPAEVLITACLSRLGIYGVMEAPSDDMDSAGVDAVVREAEFQHEHRYLRPKLGKILHDWEAKQSGFQSVGMTRAAEPPEVTAARAKLKEWGVLSA